jgi:hypothetical protein
VYKLRIVKPSWYAKKADPATSGGHKNLAIGSREESSTGYWEGFAPIVRSVK